MMDVLLIIVTALTAAVAVFLASNAKTSMIALKVIALLFGIAAVSTYIIAMDAGLGGFFLLFIFFIPIMFMLNFVLYAVVFNDVTGNLTGNLTGKIKAWTGVSIGSLIVYLYAYIFEYKWITVRTPAVWNDIFISVVVVSGTIWALSTLIIHLIMFICALKTTKGRNKKMWIIIAFFCPIVGAMLYFVKTVTSKQSA